jgi:hypothetical protein
VIVLSLGFVLAFASPGNGLELRAGRRRGTTPADPGVNPGRIGPVTTMLCGLATVDQRRRPSNIVAAVFAATRTLFQQRGKRSRIAPISGRAPA